MFSFALRVPRVSEWRRWLPLALPLAMFVALAALGGDRGYFYREGVSLAGLHNWNTAKTLAIAANLSPEHYFRLADRIRQEEDGGFGYHLYSRFPVGGYVLVKLATMPFGDDLAAKLLAGRVLAMLTFCGAAALAYLSISRITGNRSVAIAAVPLGFSGLYATYYADLPLTEGVIDVFGAALAFHGMTVFIQEGRFRQLLAKTCAALLLGWHVYALLLPFIAIGFGGEAVALSRSALASSNKARAAIISLARSRYAALAAVSILFGSALLAFNLANEYTALDGEPLSELPLVQSIVKRFGQNDDYNQREPGLAWDTFLRRQLYRAGAAVVPYALVRAVGWDFPVSEPWEVALAPAVLGAAAAAAALGALAFTRRYRILTATAVLFGFCWGLGVRHNTFHKWHLHEGLPYIALALALFTLALLGARAALGERLGGRVSIGIGAAAALAFALSVFYAGQSYRYAAGAAETNKAALAEFSAIRETARGKRVGLTFGYHESWGAESSWYWSNHMRYYRAGTSVAWNSTACDEREFDFVASRYRDESLNPLAPENRVVYLYEGRTPLDLCRAERRRLESSEPAARSVFDVYLQDGALSYLKAPCAPADYEAPFFAYLYPADWDDLPIEHRRNGFHAWNRAMVEHRGAVFDGACLMTLYLPAYPIAAVRTGQYTPGGGRVWDISITPPLDAEARARYESVYQKAASGEPAVRLGFDLYLDGDTLFYLREPCSEDDARGRFFLSVYPADVGDLPADMRETGHEILNFTFALPDGAVFDGKCMARRLLPDYGIAKIETGQWIPGGERLWDAEIAVGD